MRSSLEIYDLPTGRTRVVHQDAEVLEAPNWEPSGETLIFNCGGHLYRIAVAGGAPERIDTGFADRCNNDHGLSPDGRRIALSHRTAEGSVIYTCPADGGVPRRVTRAAPSYWHGWSPDGRDLAFCGKRDGAFNIFTVPAGGGPDRQLTGLDGRDDGHNDGPDFAPDGRIWFNSDRTGHAQLWRMNPDGSDAEQMTSGDRVNWFPHPSPDGECVVYLSYPPGTEGHPADLDVELRLMRADGTGTQTLLSLYGGQGTINVPSWAPAGDAFAFVRYSPPAP